MTKIKIVRVKRVMIIKVQRKKQANKRKTQGKKRANKLKQMRPIKQYCINSKIHHYCHLRLVKNPLKNW